MNARGLRRFAQAAAACAAAVAAGPVAAQQFQLYLDCKGQIHAGGKTRPADIQLALRDNNMTALIQRSNVLPVGERMKYTASQTHYAAVYATPLRGSVVYSTWYRSAIFVWYPDLQRLVTTRLSIDRQTADLEGEMLGARDELLARLKMRCEPTTEADAPAPKF